MSPASARYYHEQFSPLCVFPYVSGFVCFILAGISLLIGPMPAVHSYFNGLLLSVIGLSFQYMTVVDDGGGLDVRFGLFRLRVFYDDIKAVEICRMIPILDGWGISGSLRGGRACSPYLSLLARDCVVIHLNEGFIRTIRIGTNDVENLLHFLEGRIQPGLHAHKDDEQGS